MAKQDEAGRVCCFVVLKYLSILNQGSYDASAVSTLEQINVT